MTLVSLMLTKRIGFFPTLSPVVELVLTKGYLGHSNRELISEPNKRPMSHLSCIGSCHS